MSGILFLQHSKRGSGRGSGSSKSGTVLQRKTQLLVLLLNLQTLKLGFRVRARLLMVAATGPIQGRQPQALQCSQRSSLQAACLARLPMLTRTRQPALSSRQHMQRCLRRLLLSRADARLPITGMTGPPWSSQSMHSHRQRCKQLRSRRQQGARQPRTRVPICRPSPAQAVTAHLHQTALHRRVIGSR